MEGMCMMRGLDVHTCHRPRIVRQVFALVWYCPALGDACFVGSCLVGELNWWAFFGHVCLSR